MNLPKKPLTTYHTYLPSDKKKRVSFNPFLIRSQKAMLAAQVAEDPKVMFSTVKSVLQNSLVTPLSVDDMFVFDFEHLFLKLREVSVGEIVRLRFFCQNPECSENPKAYAEQDIDLRHVKTEVDKDNNPVIPLFDDVSVHLKYMTVGNLDQLDEDVEDEVEKMFDMVALCVEAVYDGDQKLDAKDFSPEQMKGFLDSLTGDQFAKIEAFFAKTPRPTLEVEYVCPECKREHKNILTGMQTFF